MKVGSLFSGIGGLDLGLERAGMTIAWHSEIDTYACKVLAKHWPGVPNHGDIKNIDWRTVEPVDVICGGYPCQPFSTAGKRRGTDDPRHLWPWVRDAISALRPRYAILENVRGHLTMGGLTVIGELAEIGYDAEWRVVSAAGVGAPHRRDRVIIVAYPNRDHESDGPEHEIRVVADANRSDTPNGRQRKDVPSQSSGRRNDRSGSGSDFGQVGMGGSRETASDVAYPNSTRLEGRGRVQKPETQSVGFDKHSTLSRWCDAWKSEPNVGRVADGVPRRMDRLRGLGNAVVPQVAEYIGRLVMAHAQHN